MTSGLLALLAMIVWFALTVGVVVQLAQREEPRLAGPFRAQGNAVDIGKPPSAGPATNVRGVV